MKYLLYLAVNNFSKIIYLDEKSMDNPKRDTSLFRDCIDNCFDMSDELKWREIKEPKDVGVYQVVVESTVEDDFEFEVLSCTPLVLVN